MTDKQYFGRYFYDDINKNRAILMQKGTILKLNPCFIFFIYII